MSQDLTLSELEMLHLRIAASPAAEREQLFAQLDQLITKLRADVTIEMKKPRAAPIAQLLQNPL